MGIGDWVTETELDQLEQLDRVPEPTQHMLWWLLAICVLILVLSLLGVYHLWEMLR